MLIDQLAAYKFVVEWFDSDGKYFGLKIPERKRKNQMRSVFEIEAKQFSLVGREIVLCARVGRCTMCIFPRDALNEN